MTPSAHPGSLPWRIGTVVTIVPETPEAKSLIIDVPQWPRHRAGQHVDLRLTAEDGDQAQRSYSIASPPEQSQVVLTVDRIPDGEVSSYLLDVLNVGDRLELRGPIGGYFSWDVVDGGPLLLIAGGSGIVPLMAMLRHRRAARSSIPVRLPYAVRTAEGVIYREELAQLAGRDAALEVIVFICGPTLFVEVVADGCLALGYEPVRIKTEHFGPTGGSNG